MSLASNLPIARIMCEEMDRPDLIAEMDAIVGNLDIDSVPVKAIRTELNFKMAEIFDIHRAWTEGCREHSEQVAEALIGMKENDE